MASILELIQGGELRRFDAGQMVIEQGGKTGLLFFLVEGAVEVLKDGVTVAKSSQPGAVFGELSARSRSGDYFRQIEGLYAGQNPSVGGKGNGIGFRNLEKLDNWDRR